MSVGADETVEAFREFFERYAEDHVAEVAQQYPSETRSVYLDWTELEVFDHELADRWQADPVETRHAAELALAELDLPAGGFAADTVHARLHNLPEYHTFYPGDFSPTDRGGEYVAIEGQVANRTDTYSEIVEAVFECQRCGTCSTIPQTDDTFQEPHECQGCERQGPFSLLDHKCECIDGQKIRIEEPPEVVSGGDASHIDVYLRDDIVGSAESGDRVIVAGDLQLRQVTSGNSKKARFRPYLDGRAVTIKQTEFEDIDVTDEEEAQIRALAEADDPDIYARARDSIAPSIVGDEYRDIKLGLFLALIGGTRVELPDGTTERGDIHQLMIGGPSTGKSSLMNAVESIAPRAVSVSGDNATKNGVTAAAVRDDFSETGEWALDPGALVQANGGVACIDELDKMPPETRKSLHEAMADQKIPINKAGINTVLPAKTAVIAAANPKKGRWDDTEEVHEQIELGSTILSRFGLIWKLTDSPDPDRDATIADAVTKRKDHAKRLDRSDIGTAVADGGATKTEPAIEADMLRKFVAFARREIPDPVFADEETRAKVNDSYVSLRGANGYDVDAAVPISSRKLEDIVRLAEAAARAELSDVITKRHVSIAQRLVGASIQQFGRNSDGDMDVDVVETGTSKSQSERVELIKDVVQSEQPREGGVRISTVTKRISEEHGLDPDLVRSEIGNMREKGELYSPGGDREEVRCYSV